MTDDDSRIQRLTSEKGTAGMSIMDVFKATSIKQENERLRTELDSQRKLYSDLRALFDEIGGREVELAKAKKVEYDVRSEALKRELVQLRQVREDLKMRIANYESERVVLEEELLLESFALYKPKFALTSSLDYKSRLERVRDSQKTLIKQGEAVRANENWTVNGSAAEGKKMVGDMKKLLLRSFNNECDYCVDNVKFNNIESFEKRIDKSFEAVRKLGRTWSAEVTQRYKDLKIDELRLAFEYQLKKQEEKEEQRKAREQLREQQKLEQEIRAAREKIAKERRHFVVAIRQLETKLTAVLTTEERADVEAKLASVRSQCADLDNAEKEVDYREKNAKAGYVYVISNLGAFGEKVFKIGMTRRLEPLDRIDELSDASVPFDFDVHALIFSDDAPALESKLHKHFEATRMNKVNRRREFFRAEIGEIETVIRQNYEKVFDLVREASASDYRESLRL